MIRRLHIAYVCADRGIPVGGQKGGSAHIGELTRALKDRGAEVRILAARANDEDDAAALPAPTVDLGAQRTVRQMRQSLYENAHGARAQVAAGEAFGLMLNPAIAKALERLHKEWRIVTRSSNRHRGLHLGGDDEPELPGRDVEAGSCTQGC